MSELDHHFDAMQPVEEEPLNVVSADSNSTVKVHVKDSVSRTGDDETPISKLNKSMFTTPSGPVKSSSVTMMEKELKRNLDAVYEVDFCSSQSSTKPRKSDSDMEEDANVTVGLLKP
ncbi:hypothetical protein HanHA300_Chr15g0568731 [Helianthus annuus]|nr:hypothetical protein HanHA300_Chr15g0568731 [Helianthus annuus]